MIRLRSRSGFTLMELLLVVAILAIVAAAAAPSFFTGASEAMNQAKKSAFLAAYSITVSGASMYASTQMAQGLLLPASFVASGTNFVPLTSRQCKNVNSKVFTLGAKLDANRNFVVTYVAGTGAEPTTLTMSDPETGWTTINGL